MRIIISVILAFYVCIGNAQLATEYGAPIRWAPYYGGIDTILSGIDTLTNDTITLTKAFYRRISEKGILIEELVLGSPEGGFECSDEGPKLSGIWKKWYSPNRLAETGRYNCNSKIGNWKYYDENGALFQEEFYLRSDEFVNKGNGFMSGESKIYYPNGQVKSIETYEVVEVLDSFVVFDSKTYSEVNSCCKWRTISLKSGMYKLYDENGDVLFIKMNRIDESKYKAIRRFK